jgi:hypothetical protein
MNEAWFDRMETIVLTVVLIAGVVFMVLHWQ